MLAAFGTVVFNLGSFAFFLGAGELLTKIFIFTSLFYISYGTTFVVAKIIGSPGKNDSLLFIQNCFKRDYDHHSTD